MLFPEILNKPLELSGRNRTGRGLIMEQGTKEGQLETNVIGHYLLLPVDTDRKSFRLKPTGLVELVYLHHRAAHKPFIAHCFYLTCPEGIARHTAWDIGHATSPDLKAWEIHDLALSRGAPDGYNGVSPATGSVIRFKGRYWLAYSGNWRRPWPWPTIFTSGRR